MSSIAQTLLGTVMVLLAYAFGLALLFILTCTCMIAATRGTLRSEAIPILDTPTMEVAPYDMFAALD